MRILLVSGAVSTCLVVALVAPGGAAADTIDAASCSQADVQSAVDSAADGDTVRVPAGACTWSDPVTPSNDRGVTLMCATERACVITAEGNAVLFNTLAGTNDHLYRISGFTFHNTGTAFLIWLDGNGTMSRIRIDHNAFEDLTEDTIAIFFGDTKGIANYYGVIDHNTMTGSTSSAFFQWIGARDDTPPPSPLGTGNNIFLEDNTVMFSTMTNAGRGCMDTWGGAALVWRHNSTLNCLVTTHGVPHNGGPQNIELYDNQLAVNAGADAQGVADGYRLFHHQGSGEFIAFNNSFTPGIGRTGDALEMTHYRSATPAAAGYDTSLGRCDGTNSLDGNRAPTSTYFGYPCWRQPGRDFAGNLVPMYVWNNAWSDTGGQIDMEVSNPWDAMSPEVSDHLRADRDYYNAVSASTQTSPTAPFDGTTGMGFGALANRPTTCTTNALEMGGGVGYFAADEGPQGTLYRCSATNTWTMHYQPYPYPHPLVSGEPPPPPPDGGVSPGVDGGGSPGADAGARADGGGMTGRDAGVMAGDGGATTPDDGGCGCVTVGSARGGSSVPAAVALSSIVLVVLAARRRR